MKKFSANISNRFLSGSDSSKVSQAYASIHIKLTNPREHYKPGDEINGVIELNVERRLDKVRGLKVAVVGLAKCEWKKGKGKSSIKFEGLQNVMDEKQLFLGKPNYEPVEVSTGIHLYRFSSKLPSNAVSSFKGTNGNISYKVVATLDLLTMKDVITEKSFTVFRIENLNDFPWMRCPIENEEDFCETFACCESQILGMGMKITKRGFALGEKISIEMSAQNRGPSTFDNATLSLDRIEVCTSQRPVTTSVKSRKIITYIKTREMKSCETLSWSEVIKIPKDMPVTNDKLCDVLKISYELNFSAKSEKKPNLSIIIPITIGHIRLKSDNHKDQDVDSDSSSSFIKMVPLRPVKEFARMSKSADNEKTSKWNFKVAI